MRKERVLIIEDEFQMRYLLRTHLEPHFELEEASSGEEGLMMLEEKEFALILLDIMMEGMDGWEVCKTVRDKGNQVPILMLTARSDTKEKVQGLNLGADDYVVKPFDPDELIARMNALLRRTEQKTDNPNESKGVIKIGELTLNSYSREILVKSTPVELTAKEFDLIYHLASNPNWANTRDMLLNNVWGETKILDFRTVDSHVRHVRDKLQKGGLSFNPIKTVWGVGYKFNLPDDKNV